MKNNKINLPLYILGLLLCVCVITFAIYSTSSGMLYVVTDGDPAITAASFFESLQSSHPYEAEDETSKKIYDSFIQSLSYRQLDAPQIHDFDAAVPFVFSYMDMGALEEKISSSIDELIKEKVSTTSRHDLYDENGNYKSTFLEYIYKEAVESSISNCPTITDGYILPLKYSDSAWAVTEDITPVAQIVESIDGFKLRVLNDYLSEADVIKKTYKIAEDATEGFEPNPECYGVVSYENASEIYDVIEKARQLNLLGPDEEVSFSADANFYQNGSIEYYLDDTILAICWKEWIDNRPVNLSEIKIADASQFRRKLSGDAYGSGVQNYCSTMSKQANAVVGLNADFYAFRNLGITCYDRVVYRFNENSYGSYKAYNAVDTLFIDSNGDFKYFKRGTESTKEEVQKWVDENNILFSVAFGPVIVDNGELISEYSYPIGEYYKQYSRAGIGQLGSLHYLYINVQNISGREDIPRATLADFAKIMNSKGVINGYNLDGGQTGEVYFNNHVFNHVDWGNERTVSDIIYFATALPESER